MNKGGQYPRSEPGGGCEGYLKIGGGCEGVKKTVLLAIIGLLVLFLVSTTAQAGGGAGSGFDVITGTDGGGAGSGFEYDCLSGGGAGSGGEIPTTDGGGAGSG
ncbi:MAG: hypothetical protein V3U20_04820 [Thermoplasmata archaeon]